jgi:hypothetical protein
LLRPPSAITWPLGEQVLHPSAEAQGDALAPDPWVDLKLRAGRWYLGVVEHFAAELGPDRLDRYAGVEMALDGCLANLSSAIDAAMARLVTALEGLHDEEPEPDHRPKPPRARTLLKKGGTAPSLDAYDEAVSRDGDDTTGWLSQLRDARNRSMHQTTLSRHWTGGTGSSTVLLTVPGRALPVEPAAWLAEALDQATELAGGLLRDADATGHLPPAY